MPVTRQYQLPNSKRNVWLSFSVLTSYALSVPVCRLLWWTSVFYSQHNDYFFTVDNRKVGNIDWIMLCRKFNNIFSPVQPLHYKSHPESHILVTKYRIFRTNCLSTNIKFMYIKIKHVSTTRYILSPRHQIRQHVSAIL